MIGVLALVGACGGHSTDGPPLYLDPGSSRAATIRSLDVSLCNSHLVKAASFARFWVGTCSDRTIFEKPVYFQVFTSTGGKRSYLERYEACVRGRYVEGPRWIALAVRASDEQILVHGGGRPLPCTNTRLPQGQDHS